jgi:hypothetical protein
MAKTNAALADHAEPTSPRVRRRRGEAAAASKPAKQGRGAKNRQRGSDHVPANRTSSSFASSCSAGRTVPASKSCKS